MSGPYLVDEIGRFTAEATISGSALAALKRNVLDSLGCAIAALDGEIIQTLRDQTGECALTP
jgi:2-methylcitrate dehydratase